MEAQSGISVDALTNVGDGKVAQEDSGNLPSLEAIQVCPSRAQQRWGVKASFAFRHRVRASFRQLPRIRRQKRHQFFVEVL